MSRDLSDDWRLSAACRPLDEPDRYIAMFDAAGDGDRLAEHEARQVFMGCASIVDCWVDVMRSERVRGTARWGVRAATTAEERRGKGGAA